jgi:hypothetical protein
MCRSKVVARSPRRSRNTNTRPAAALRSTREQARAYRHVPIRVGGKTGSGDNRVESFARQAQLIASRVTSRTAGFVFYVGDHWFGVITASVTGPEAAHYTFTSALPLAVLKLLAPVLSEAIRGRDARDSTQVALPTKASPFVARDDDAGAIKIQSFDGEMEGSITPPKARSDLPYRLSASPA